MYVYTFPGKRSKDILGIEISDRKCIIVSTLKRPFFDFLRTFLSHKTKLLKMTKNHCKLEN